MMFFSIVVRRNNCPPLKLHVGEIPSTSENEIVGGGLSVSPQVNITHTERPKGSANTRRTCGAVTGLGWLMSLPPLKNISVFFSVKFLVQLILVLR